MRRFVFLPGANIAINLDQVIVVDFATSVAYITTTAHHNSPCDSIQIAGEDIAILREALFEAVPEGLVLS